MSSSVGENNINEQQQSDSGAMCICALLAIHGQRANPDQIAHEFANQNGIVDAAGIIRAARRAEFKAKIIRADWKKIQKLPLPGIAKLNDERFVLLAKAADDKLLVQFAGKPPEEISREDFELVYDGQMILIAKRAADMIGDLKFGFSWFLPVIAKYKTHFTEVIVASLFLQVFGLISPLFFQVIIDKVLVHRGLTTLDVLVIGLVGLTIFEVLLGWLRTYLFSHTTSRVDVQLGAQLFKHLLELPISYFESRPTGQIVARVRELENVRDFITSSALTVLIDFSFTFVFFAVMWLFSPTLTLIVLGSIPFYLAISLLITPELRRRVEERFYRGANNQAFLVESIAGAETLKSMAVEPQMRARWDENLAAYVKASFRTITLGSTGSQLVMLVNKITTALVLYFGAKLAITGQLTVGQLVAFNMLAGQVSQPIIRIAQLWQDFQQFRISIERLGDILNTKTESKDNSVPESLPPLKGVVELKNVTFRYRPGEAEVLRDLSLKIEPGTTVGIVGRSGSGKSTITKLIQRLHVPENGRVLLDGMDSRLLDPAWMRRQIGVVLQDNILFNSSVRDNIALSNPAMPMKTILQAAELSGAHEFILQLPKGYDTVLEERGSNLSGGQRQRIAIARALAVRPRILILDEATAALDYESERLFQENLRKISVGRTVIIIAHRLSTVRNADNIIVMDEGKIREQGNHKQLIENDGFYAWLVKAAEGE
ncbi:type I secretion system permease/ATPase [Maritalea sp.]|uniref:type I secretion system permease/ATPase n=1 Tax=Maritalea sp. TaxID=2003361 RepID=UPI0039E6F821